MATETVWVNHGGECGPLACNAYPGFLLKKIKQEGYPRWWLILSDEPKPKVKANLGDCHISEAKLRFMLWMEGKTWN